MNKPKTYKTTCSYCGVGCGIVIHKSPSGKLRLEGDKDHPVNKGMLCSKGRNLLYAVKDQSDRLLYPQLRDHINDDFKRISWEMAIDTAADKFNSIIDEYGSDSVAFYVSGQCLTEEYYVANKLVKGFLGTNNIDTNSRLCMSSAVMGYKLALGDDTVPASYEDIELADTFLISGANPAWCHPILFRRLENHKQKNPETKIIVIDPRVTDSCSIADIHLQLNPGTDIDLTNAIAKVIINEDLIDYNFIKNHTNGFESVTKLIRHIDLEESAKKTGVTIEDIIRTARLIGKSKGFMSLWAMGLNQSSEGVNKNLSLLNLSLLTGQIGKPGSGPLSLTGQPNAMGGREVGGMATLLAAHHNLASAEHRKKIQEFWKSKEIAPKPGLTATEMVESLEKGELKAVWIICTNPLVSMPNLNRTEKAFRKADFVVVQDISNRSDSIDFAHMVLPAAGWMEKEGTMTNSERRISYLPKIVDAPGDAKPDVEILCEFAKTMGYQGFDYKNPVEIFNEYRQLTKGTTIDISRLSYDKLKKSTIQWPVDSNNDGTKRLFSNSQFYTTDKKACLYAVEAKKLEEITSVSLPFTLTTGRIRDQWHTMTRTGKVSKLNEHIKNPWISIHPKMAAAKGIKDGDIIEVTNQRGTVNLKAHLDSTIKENMLFAPMHWSKVVSKNDGRANNLTSSNIDAVSKQPEFKLSAVTVAKRKEPMRKIVLIGAGSAAFSFISEHRKNNRKDEITVITNEKDAFYNRIELPEYINESKEWSSLQKATDAEIKTLDINLVTNTFITEIDRKLKQVIDLNNSIYTYDKLILTTGSKPLKPIYISENANGVFTLRNRFDADKIKSYITKNSLKSVNVMGGGILGLEIADALNEYGLTVELYVRGNKLLNRQLDDKAASLLSNIIQEKGIKLNFNKESQSIDNVEDKQHKTIFKDQSSITSDCTILALGTTPALGLAKDAGLEINKGVIVNQFLQTGDPDIFAIGEIAEHQNKLHGISIAAEEQAKACANYFAGNYFENYKGSISINLLKCKGLEVCSLGVIDTNDPSVEEIILSDPNKGYYKKCLVKDDKLIGSILVGDISEFTHFKELIANKTELGEERNNLLRSSENTSKVEGELVCSCNQVGRGNIEYFVNNGCTSFEGLMVLTRAGTGCGSCKPEVKKILESAKVVAD